MKSASPAGATAPRPRIVRRLVTTGLALTLGAAMLGAAASAASWLDRILLGLGGVTVSLYAILWQSELFDRSRNAAIVLIVLIAMMFVIGRRRA